MIASDTNVLSRMSNITPKAVKTEGFGNPHRTQAWRKMYVKRNSNTGIKRRRKKQHASKITGNTIAP
jgi:hypothetical protein